MSTTSTGARSERVPHPCADARFQVGGSPPRVVPSFKPYLWQLLNILEIEFAAIMATVDDRFPLRDGERAALELRRVGLLAAFRHVKKLTESPTLPADPLIDLEDLQEVHDFLTMQEKDGSADLRFVAQAKAKLQELMGRGVKS